MRNNSLTQHEQIKPCTTNNSFHSVIFSRYIYLFSSSSHRMYVWLILNFAPLNDAINEIMKIRQYVNNTTILMINKNANIRVYTLTQDKRRIHCIGRNEHDVASTCSCLVASRITSMEMNEWWICIESNR